MRAIVNYSRPDAPGGGAGETDVVVQADYPEGGGTLLLSIEDKVWAAPQRNQGERRRAFVESHPARWGLALLIGPGEWIIGYPDEGMTTTCAFLSRTSRSGAKTTASSSRAVFRQACVPPVRACAGFPGLAHRR